VQIAGAELIRQLVLDNQVMVGSVNAARGHFQTGADDLEQARSRWGTHLDGLITQRYAPAEFTSSSDPHTPDAIKEVVEWTTLVPGAQNPG
jgi:glucose 1-dehydrogenase